MDQIVESPLGPDGIVERSGSDPLEGVQTSWRIVGPDPNAPVPRRGPQLVSERAHRLPQRVEDDAAGVAERAACE